MHAFVVRTAEPCMAGRPKGRPPIRHCWMEGTYVHEEVGVPYAACRDEHKEALREIRKRVRRERYSGNVSDVRDKQRAYLCKRRRDRGAAPRKRRAPNCTLDAMLVGAFSAPAA